MTLTASSALAHAGQMMTQPLIISDLLEYAAAHHGTREIISRRLEGDIHRYTYRDALKRSKQLANALLALGVQPGDRVATLAWNGYRHFECYYAISGIGAICHTVNPRLYTEQVEYIINHAEDCYVFLDACFAKLLEPVADKLTSVKGFIFMIDADQMPQTRLPNAINYEDLMTTYSSELVWPRFPQDTASGLCYTSGTTGNPKGVLYSHASTVLHAYASRNPDALNVSADSVVMPVVPMYHVCAWGMPYIAPMSGATLVLPGDGMDGQSLHELIELAEVDLMLGVPTVWLGLIDYLKRNNKRMDSVKTVGVGGSASPKSLVETLDKEYGVYLLPIWGMTETSPLATLGSPTKAMQKMSDDERYRLQTTAGRPMFGIELEIFGEDDQPLPHDGTSRGYLRVRGPWVLTAYYKNEKPDSFFIDVDGKQWFDTGDIAVIDENSYLQIVDRAKDVVKSGGEWISSIDLENAAVGHPDVKEACVIGVRHQKWDERPLLFIVKSEESDINKQDIYNYLESRVAKWWLPDDILFVEELPHTATGKLQKRTLRDEYIDYLVEKA
ncbi:long-chain-fatty-acid--CoA ligase [Thalassolituus alkanivorans]|uniref:long-chain-fatty-acid--CoA ligase n=1 Tax=Thalassolituus alkanivorans TaxID=2881055 RepID=UPI001E293C01|nr:long-chain-fatty-acid--CoA ligase [Thalassolituus alkanivorans]MCB2386041.1 long-chain-fatty-acid--CoA ligase [Thalassolituus alkanivorans]MCB2423029.1 long-chain-fatty-acid--CoA ligase [Thalassolituus alkanivorans]